jgi:hypothetical protein
VKDTAMEMDSAEIGIPELIKLYYDVYDEKKNEFVGMSPEMEKKYQEDVDTFYKTFTGKEVETDENGDKKITKFEQISLREFHKSDGCKPEGVYTTPYEGSLNKSYGEENLFEKYARHATKMMNTMNSNQDKLLAILKKLFKFQKVKEPEKEVDEEKKIKEESTAAVKTEVPAEVAAADKPYKIVTETAVPIVYQGQQGQAVGPVLGDKAPVLGPGLGDKAPVIEPVLEPVIEPVVGPVVEETKVPSIENKQVLKGQATDLKGGDKKDITEEVIINPDLDEELLQTLVNSARQLIVNLYITCEEDFLEGLHIFEAIVATQLGKTTNSQVKLLDQLTLDYFENQNKYNAD